MCTVNICCYNKLPKLFSDFSNTFLEVSIVDSSLASEADEKLNIFIFVIILLFPSLSEVAC